MKLQRACVCVLTTGLLTTGSLTASSWAQEAVQRPEPAAQAASDKSAATRQDDEAKSKEAVPEKVVTEKEAIEQLVGDYRIVSGENSGKEILPERLADVTVRITEKTLTTYDGQRNARFSATYRLDTQQRPWRIKMASSPRPGNAGAAQNAAAASPAATSSDGLIERADGRVKLIYALPGGSTPQKLVTGDRQQMFVLERLPDPIEKAKKAADPPAAEKEDASPSKAEKGSATDQ